jgi:hypothetical protein
MSSFQVSQEGARLLQAYPTPKDFAAAVLGASIPERDGIVRLWLTEGVPFAFQRLPLLYESARNSLASELRLEAKAITMIGSGRIGYSLKPVPTFGEPFTTDSDLDFSAVSQTLFTDLQDAFLEWKRDVDEGRMIAQTPGELRYWPENLSRLPRNLQNGYIDYRKIPFKYDAPRRINGPVFRLQRKLERTAGAPRVSGVSLHIYRDWDALVRRQALSLRWALGDRP